MVTRDHARRLGTMRSLLLVSLIVVGYGCVTWSRFLVSVLDLKMAQTRHDISDTCVNYTCTTDVPKRTPPDKYKTPGFGNTSQNDHNRSETSVCTNAMFMPKGSMPYIALLSFPGAGNTWLRYLIEKVTGIYTGSIYEDKGLLKGGFLGEAEPHDSGRLVAVKMHSVTEDPDGIIFLIRNPYSAITSDFNRLCSRGNHLGFGSDEAFKSKNWTMYAKWAAMKWALSVQKCMEMVRTKKLVVYYEDLSRDLPRQLRLIVSFLGLPLDQSRLQCTLTNREGNFHRKSNNLTFDPFTDDIKLAVDSAVIHARQIMWKYGGPLMKPYERNKRRTNILKIIKETFKCDPCERLTGI